MRAWRDRRQEQPFDRTIEAPMRGSSKGQITIPVERHEQFDRRPGSEVCRQRRASSQGPRERGAWRADPGASVGLACRPWDGAHACQNLKRFLVDRGQSLARPGVVRRARRDHDPVRGGRPPRDQSNPLRRAGGRSSSYRGPRRRPPRTGLAPAALCRGSPWLATTSWWTTRSVGTGRAPPAAWGLSVRCRRRPAGLGSGGGNERARTRQLPSPASVSRARAVANASRGPHAES